MSKWQPAYYQSLKEGLLDEKIQAGEEHMTACYLCPHQCGLDRREGQGICQAPDQAIVASHGPHFGEEAPLVGRNGSGTIFFGHCNLKCVFCQNHDLSFQGRGVSMTSEELAEVMLNLQNRYRCHNINLVTPTHFVPSIIKGVALAAEQGLQLPLVYNCGGYESLDTLALLDGIVDIYMPDFKYSDPDRGLKYSQVQDYPQKAMAALKEMDRQVGGLVTDARGIARRGLLIRHLMLPGGLEDTIQVLNFIKEELSPHCLVNLMDQYYPAHQAHLHPELRKRLSRQEFQTAYSHAKKLGLRLAR